MLDIVFIVFERSKGCTTDCACFALTLVVNQLSLQVMLMGTLFHFRARLNNTDNPATINLINGKMRSVYCMLYALELLLSLAEIVTSLVGKT